jgi:erythromycin esterase-like protein
MRSGFLRLAGLLWGLVACSCLASQPLTGGDDDYDALLAMIGPARVVMLGESTHGSREFYRERVRITRRLIEEQGFGAVVFEAPWEPVRRLDAYVGGAGRDPDAVAALGDFRRFPDWTWRNSEVRDFAESLRVFNRARAGKAPPVRLYGMDLYSLPESADSVVRHLARRSIAAAAVARQRYICFDNFLAEPIYYGREVDWGRAPSCAAAAAAQLTEMAPAPVDEDDFLAWQSARVVSSAESYFRAMYIKGEISWNVRERHLADTLSQLLERLGPRGRIVVWAHNLHQGDARATDQGQAGELSAGQLMRERYGDDAVLVGFSTHSGQVRAATEWGAPDRVWEMPPALPQSTSGRLHYRGPAATLLIFRGNPALAAEFTEREVQRAIGVIYVRHDELRNHYFYAVPSAQFDALIHLDVTSALDSLGRR